MKELLSSKDVMVILPTGFGKNFGERINIADIKNVPCDRFADAAVVRRFSPSFYSLVNLKHYRHLSGKITTMETKSQLRELKFCWNMLRVVWARSHNYRI